MYVYKWEALNVYIKSILPSDYSDEERSQKTGTDY